MISNHSEGTFERLRYLLGGDRQSNCPPDTVSHHDKWCGLANTARVVSTSASPRKLSRFNGSYLSCASCAEFQYQATVKLHGVFPSWGNLHLHRYYDFTEFSLRQCPNRYAFRAGRNLPDKEFYCLRTVIVTAVYCFDS